MELRIFRLGKVQLRSLTVTVTDDISVRAHSVPSCTLMAYATAIHLSTSDRTSPSDLRSPPSDVGSALYRHEVFDDAQSLARIDRPPTHDQQESLPPPKVFRPWSLAVVALLMPASVFGVLARLGLQALVTYDGRSIFPLAYVQAIGCLIMGIALRLKDPLGDL